VASSRTLHIEKDRDAGGDDEQQEDNSRRAGQTPDERFMACCIDRNLPDSCLNKCSFGAFTRATLQVYIHSEVWSILSVQPISEHVLPS